MKNRILISIAITVASLVSCSYARKTQRSIKSASEVVEEKSNASVQAAVIDSIGVEEYDTVEKCRFDSAYTRTTTTREYFSGEFDFDIDSSKIDSSANGNIGSQVYNLAALVYRETVVNERGALTKVRKNYNKTQEAVRIQKVEAQNDNASVVKFEKAADSKFAFTVDRRGRAIAFLITLFIAIGSYLACRYLKKK